MAQWQALPGAKSPRQANTFTDGVDGDNNAFFVSLNAYVSGYGWDFDKHPSLATRRGRTTYGSAGNGQTRLLTNFGITHLVRAIGTQLSYWNGSTWVDIAGSFADTDWDSTNFDINGPALIMTNGSDTPRYWNGSALAELTGTPPVGKYIASDNRRVYIAVKDEVHYCAFQDALNWTSAENSGIVEYYTPNGGDITGMRAFEGNIWVFKKDAYCLIFHTGDSRATHRLVEGSNDIGCVSFKTIAEVGPYLMWLGQNGVYIGAGGAAREIGEPVRNILQTINPAAVDAACAWTDGRMYYLCLPTGLNTTPDTELVYSPEYKKWHIRSISLGGMRYGAQLNNVSYGGWASGQVYKLNDGTTDAGTAIQYRVTSRPYDEGFKEAEKEYYQMKLQGFLDAGASLAVSISTEDRGESFVILDTMAAGTVTQSKDVIVPMDTVPLTHWMRYRLEGTGYIEINEVQRYARVQPVQE